MVPYVDIIGLCHGVQFYEKSMWCGINVMWGGITSISSEFQLWGFCLKTLGRTSQFQKPQNQTRNKKNVTKRGGS